MKRNTQQSVWKRLAVCGAVAWGISLCSIAGAATLLTDNFTAPDGTLGAINANLASRQSGAAATATISWAGGYGGWPSINSNRLLLEGGGGWPWNGTIASYDHDFNDSAGVASGLRIEFDLDLYESNNAVDNNVWFGISVGHTLASRLNTTSYADPQAELGIVLHNNGLANQYLGGAAGPAVPSFSTVAGQIHHVDLQLHTPDFNLGTAASVELLIDGTPLDLNGGAAGTAAQFAWDGDLTNYIAFESRNFLTPVGGIALDNLEISTLVPEPSVLALLGVAALTLASRRRYSRAPKGTMTNTDKLLRKKGTMKNALSLFAVVVLLGTLPATTQAAMYVVNTTSNLHYTSQAAFDNEWRKSYNTGYGQPGYYNAGGTDGDVLFHGFGGYGDFRIYDSVNAADATDISVFDVRGAGPDQAFHAMQDFRIVFGNGAENVTLNLAAVSPSGNNSIVARLYNNGNINTTYQLGFVDFNFNTAASNPTYGTGPTLNLSTSVWYRMAFDMTRETADPTKVDLNLSIYNIVGGLKGAGTGSLVSNYALNGVTALGDYVQFGMAPGATYIWGAYVDNLLASSGTPEPSTVALLGVGALLLTVWRRRRGME